jgi:hypothetical protein
MNLLGLYRWFGVVPQGFVVLFPVVLGGDFWSPLLVVFSVCFRDLALGDLMGEIRVNPPWFFCLWSPSQIRELRGSILGFFGVLGLEEFLVGFLRFLLMWQVLVDKIMARCSYHPQSLVQVRGAIREIEIWIWRSWPAGAVHPELPRIHRSDRCSWPVWPMRVTCGICLGWTAWLLCLWVLVLLVSSWFVWSWFVRFWVGFSFRASCVLGVFLFQGLEKSLRLFGTLVVRLL